jgi:Ca-activated chloride channel family protein
VTATAPGIELPRPPLSVVLSVDTSGSMAGPAIEHVVESIDRLVAVLQPTDRVAVVAFSNNAAEITPLLFATPETRRRASTRCHRLVAEGGTNIEAGLARAAAMLPPRAMHERQRQGLAHASRPPRPARQVPRAGHGRNCMQHGP